MANERERLAQLLYGLAGGGASWGSGDSAAAHDVEFAYEDADAVLAAGFGDMEAAKAGVLERFEGYITNTIDSPDARESAFCMIAEFREGEATA